MAVRVTKEKLAEAPPAEPISASAYAATVMRMVLAAHAAVHQSGEATKLGPEAADIHGYLSYHVRVLSQELLRATKWVGVATQRADRMEAKLEQACAMGVEMERLEAKLATISLDLQRARDELVAQTASSAAVEAELAQELEQSNDRHAQLEKKLWSLESENEALREQLAGFLVELSACAAEQAAPCDVEDQAAPSPRRQPAISVSVGAAVDGAATPALTKRVASTKPKPKLKALPSSTAALNAKPKPRPKQKPMPAPPN